MAETLSDFGLKLNYWYLTNRQQLKKWWVLVLLAVDVFLLAAVLTNGILMVLRFHDVSNVVASITAETKDVGALQSAIAPKPLQVSAIATTAHGLGRYDFSVRMENTNPTWSATVTVQFTGGAKTLSPVRLVVPPKSVRYAMALDVEAPGQPTASATNDVAWKRVTLDEAKPLDVSVRDLLASTKILVSGSQVSRQVTQATGTVVNRTFSTLKSLRVGIVLIANGATVGVRSAIITSIGPEQTAPFSVEWDTVIPDVQSVEAYPELSPEVVHA